MRAKPDFTEEPLNHETGGCKLVTHRSRPQPSNAIAVPAVVRLRKTSDFLSLSIAARDVALLGVPVIIIATQPDCQDLSAGVREHIDVSDAGPALLVGAPLARVMEGSKIEVRPVRRIDNLLREHELTVASLADLDGAPVCDHNVPCILPRATTVVGDVINQDVAALHVPEVRHPTPLAAAGDGWILPERIIEIHGTRSMRWPTALDPPQNLLVERDATLQCPTDKSTAICLQR